MATTRKTGGRGGRDLTARSVLASMLLGTDPPELPGPVLVRAAGLFGISEGTARVALSRMVAAGELEADAGRYRLTGRLARRQSRQAESRHPRTRAWHRTWELAVARAEPRPAGERSALREAMQQLRLAPLREGVWGRPDNLERRRLPEARAVVEAQCSPWHGRPVEDAAALAAELWDLDRWAAEAVALADELGATTPALEAGDTTALARGFVLSATVLRHFLHDPLLPAELLPPGWPGGRLRTTYDRYDAAYRALLRDWLRRP